LRLLGLIAFPYYAEPPPLPTSRPWRRERTPRCPCRARRRFSVNCPWTRADNSASIRAGTGTKIPSSRGPSSLAWGWRDGRVRPRCARNGCLSAPTRGLPHPAVPLYAGFFTMPQTTLRSHVVCPARRGAPARCKRRHTAPILTRSWPTQVNPGRTTSASGGTKSKRAPPPPSDLLRY